MLCVVPAWQLLASFFFSSLFLWLRVFVRATSVIVLHHAFPDIAMLKWNLLRGFFNIRYSATWRRSPKISPFPPALWCFYILGCYSETLMTPLARWRCSSLLIWGVAAWFNNEKRSYFPVCFEFDFMPQKRFSNHGGFISLFFLMPTQESITCRKCLKGKLNKPRRRS